VYSWSGNTFFTSATPNGDRQVAKRTDEKAPSAVAEVMLPASVLSRYVGDYELAPGFTVTIAVADGRLVGTPTGQPTAHLVATSETEFTVKEVDARVTFVVDASGKVEKLVLHQGGQDIPGPKVK